jgi:hypothetical protein
MLPLPPSKPQTLNANLRESSNLSLLIVERRLRALTTADPICVRSRDISLRGEIDAARTHPVFIMSHGKLTQAGKHMRDGPDRH